MAVQTNEAAVRVRPQWTEDNPRPALGGIDSGFLAA